VMFQVLAPNTPTTGQAPFSQRRPPEPRIQPSPRPDLNKFRVEENQALTSYHWVDKNAGIVSIPINQAIRLSAEGQQPVPAPNVPAGASVPLPSTSPSADTSVASPAESPPGGASYWQRTHPLSSAGSTPPGQPTGSPTASPQPNMNGTATGGRMGGTQTVPPLAAPQTTAPPTAPPRQPGAAAPTGTRSGPPPTGAAPTGANQAASTTPPTGSR
jgi:hypothetical protein